VGTHAALAFLIPPVGPTATSYTTPPLIDRVTTEREPELTVVATTLSGLAARLVSVPEAVPRVETVLPPFVVARMEVEELEVTPTTRVEPTALSAVEAMVPEVEKTRIGWPQVR
jgi:hypothetical protein